MNLGLYSCVSGRATRAVFLSSVLCLWIFMPASIGRCAEVQKPSWSESWTDKAKDVRPNQGPRFTDNGNGAVTDNRTGLVWLKHASCFKDRTWDEAVVDVAELADGAVCDGVTLRDGSKPGDWRMPSIQ